jgi:hypothetical protein
LILASIALVAGGGATFVAKSGPQSDVQPELVGTSAASSGLRSLAVLPFANLSADPENAFFRTGSPRNPYSPFQGE